MTDVYEPRYRIEPYGYGVEPQMSYICRGGAELWLPLNGDGYWLEPEAYSAAEVTKHVEMTQYDAQRAITCARRINGEQVLRACSIEDQRGEDE